MLKLTIQYDFHELFRLGYVQYKCSSRLRRKAVVYIYAFGKGRTQFIRRMFPVLSNSYSFVNLLIS
jgi:hypothetical protein